jgi:hypothetical protein
VDSKHRAIVTAASDHSARPVRVIGLNQRCPLEPPAEMILLSLELWTTFFALRWSFGTAKPADEIDLRLEAGLTWEATDDRKNHYIGGDYGGSGGNSPHWVATTWFSPTLEPTAGSLKLRFDSPLGDSAREVDVNLAR